jgi:hypothetical protein
VPQFGINILSQSKMLNHFTISYPSGAFIAELKTGDILTKAEIINGLYYLPIEVLHLEERLLTTITHDENTTSIYKLPLQLLHERMEHINLKAINEIAKSFNINITNKNDFKIEQCPACNEAKLLQQRHKISLSNYKELDYLEKVASDICGPIKPRTFDGYKYFITFLDKKTRYLEVRLLKSKK